MGSNAISSSSYGVIQRLYEWEQRAVLFFLLVVFLWNIAIPALPNLPTQWHGAWLDKAVSEALSQKYEIPVRAQNVRFSGWFKLSCGSLTVSSANNGNLLFESSRTSIALVRMPTARSPQVESQIDFEDLTLYKAFYESQNLPKPWGGWLKKPIPIKHLRMHVLQDEDKMKVSVVQCEADGVKIDGFVEYFKTGEVIDKITVDLSRWRFIKLAV